MKRTNGALGACVDHPGEVRIQMEILDTDALIIGRGQTYFGDDGEVLLIQHSWLTTDHILPYERNLLWEQQLKEGPDA